MILANAFRDGISLHTLWYAPHFRSINQITIYSATGKVNFFTAPYETVQSVDDYNINYNACGKLMRFCSTVWDGLFFPPALELLP